MPSGFDSPFKSDDASTAGVSALWSVILRESIEEGNWLAIFELSYAGSVYSFSLFEACGLVIGGSELYLPALAVSIFCKAITLFF
mgnify:FL=1